MCRTLGRRAGRPPPRAGAAGRADQGGEGQTMSDLPSVDESFERLHRAGWSVGEWILTGTNGENVLEARSQTQAEAWWRGCEQARAVGMLAAGSTPDYT